MAMTKVAEVVVGAGGSASIEFTNIPQTGKDLLVLFSTRITGNANVISKTRMTLNGDTGANYSYRDLYGTGSTAASFGNNPDTRIDPTFTTPTSNATANTFSNGSYYIANYTVSQNKAISHDAVSENNATESGQNILAGRYGQTTAITSLTLTVAGTIAEHSTASLYIIS